jgi:hypothetical protein
MKYEEISGAKYHGGDLVCKECVAKFSKCNMNHTHKPQCPICKAELVPLRGI